MRWWDVATLLPTEQELFGASAWSAETFWSELAQRATRSYLVAEADVDADVDAEVEAGAGLLGYAGLMLSGSQADVQTIAVAASAQGRGVGAVLLQALVDEALRRGAGALLLEVRADNEPAIRLYRRFGFDRLAVRRGYYQPGDVDALVMRRRPLRRAMATSGGAAG
jgi:ribosomal-protein-alanine N-acetyltransferase